MNTRTRSRTGSKTQAQETPSRAVGESLQGLWILPRDMLQAEAKMENVVETDNRLIHKRATSRINKRTSPTERVEKKLKAAEIQ